MPIAQMTIMSQCPLEEENLSAFVDGELPAGQHRLVARHLMDCPECAAQAGHLLAVKRYLALKSEEPAVLGEAFWQRLDQAIDLVDAIAARANVPPTPPRARRRAVALAGVGALLILAALVFRVAAVPAQVRPSTFVRAHQSLSAAFFHGPVAPVAWTPGDQQQAGRTWLPQARLDQALAADITQQLYSVASLPLSVFTVPGSRLDLKRLQPITVGAQEYYVATEGRTSLLAWWQHDRWQVLAADTSLSQLLTLAEAFQRLDLP